MTTFERRQRIMRLIQQQTNVQVVELARLLDVSEGTIRNDFAALEEDDLLMRVRGGAVAKNGSTSPSGMIAKAITNMEAKRRIAQWAADMIENGDSILLDASTTILSIASFLYDHRHLTIVTNGIEVARQLAQNPSHTVILLGGVLRTDGNVILSTLGTGMLKDLYIKTAFVSCKGFTIEHGLMESDLQQAQLKAAMLQSVQRVVALVDSSKFDRMGFTPFASIDQLSYIVTDDGIAPEMVERLRRTQVTLAVCGETTVNTFSAFDSAQNHFTIGFANLSEQQIFAVDVRRSLERASQSASHVDLILADNQLDGGVALAVADTLIAHTVDLAIEFQIDESVGNLLMDKYQRAGIPVIAVDIPMVGATFFGVDNYRAGYMAGVALGEWINAHWDGQFDHLVVLDEPRTGVLPAARIQGQINGFQEVVGILDGADILRADSGNTADVSDAAVMQIMARLPNARRIAIISFNDDVALGALAAARRLNRENDVVIVGMGADRRMREEIRKPQSRIIGATTFMPERYGEALIDLALRILRGDPVPPAEYTEHVFIHKGNIDDFYAD